MKNIVIYSTQKQSNLVSILSNIEETNIRIEAAEEIKEFSLLKPALIIIEEGVDVKDIIMTTKFPCPLLFIGDTPEGVTVRALSYDIIKTPVDNKELEVRVSALLKTMDLRETLAVATTTDKLTGLHNRNYLQERLEAEISRAKRYNTSLSCLLFDIDFFKVVNDMYGYEWGDILLRSLADKLKSLVRKEDILTRYGDEEFLLVLPNTPEENAFLFAERFRREIERMEFIPAGEEERHPITISGGISTYPCLENVEEDANTVIRYAEHALYNAKKRGKNKIIQFSQIN
ncbi:MAG: GGDEF domain-containing protein, partial [bacterium]|nr:GGDEF domain-containing protein [bacterium]